MFIKFNIKFLLLFFLLYNFALTSFSQVEEDAYQTVKGKVMDRDSKSPLPGAVVVIVGSKPLLGNISDTSGYFKIEKVPVGRQTIKVSYIGYEDVVLQNITVTSEQDISLKIEMNESVNTIKEVVITAKLDKDKALNTMASISARTFSIDEAQRYAGGVTDPSRMAQAFAGVAATSNGNNEIVIRGNSPRGLLWRIEGLEIPNPNHFREDEGTTGGGVCILSSNVISNSDFFTSAFPAEYGNALSGVFDLNLRKGSDEFLQSSVQLSVVGTEISLEGPLYKKRESSFLINYRYSTFALLSQMGIKVSEETIIPQFQDLTFNVSLPSNKLGHTSIFGIMGKSSSGLKATKDTLFLADKNNRFEEFDQGNVWITGITNNYLASNKKTSFKTLIALMGEDNKMTNDTMDFHFNDHRIYNEELSYTTFRASFTANHKFSARHTIHAGVIFSDEFYNLYSSGYDFDLNQNKKVFASKGNTYTMQGFLEWKYRLSDKLTLNTGLHYLRFFLNKDNSIEPRAGLVWQMNTRQSLSFGMGLHSRIEPISIYLTNINLNDTTISQPNKNLSLSKSLHTVLGYDISFTEDLHLKVEAYYQYLYDIPVGMGLENDQFSLLNLRYGFVSIPLINKGTGRNYGLDVTFEQYFSKSYYFMISGSLYDSRYTPYDGKEYSTTFNGNYIFNALFGKEWTFGSKKNKTIGMNARFLYRGGMRYQGINLEASNLAGQAVYNKNENYTLITPDVYNFDVGVNYKRNRQKYSWIVSLDITNLNNQKSIIGMKYNVYTGSIKYDYDLLLLPILSIKFNF
ncbi:MAG: TonB-dependent receptor [Bacteroidota bacterium]